MREVQDVFNPAGKPITREEVKAAQRETEKLRKRDERQQEEALKEVERKRRKAS